METSDPVPKDVDAQPFHIDGALRVTISKLAEAICQHHQAVQEALRPIAKVFTAYLEATRDSPQVQAVVTEDLIGRGWFVTYNFTDRLFYALRDLFRDSKYEDADAVMAEFTRRQEAEVEAELLRRFPPRNRIFAHAFQAHRDGKYTLSIPTFLAQSDGVGCEVLGIPKQFFPHQERKKGLEGRLGKLHLCGQPYEPSGVMKSMLDQLLAPTSLAEQTAARDSRPEGDPRRNSLNRHGVLHGQDTDYDTEENSLRCILLLRYLCDVAGILQEEIPGHNAELNQMWERVAAREQE